MGGVFAWDFAQLGPPKTCGVGTEWNRREPGILHPLVRLKFKCLVLLPGLGAPEQIMMGGRSFWKGNFAVQTTTGTRYVWLPKSPSTGFQPNVTLLHSDRLVSWASVSCS